MSSQLVFVTGANGFLGAHIVYQLLKSGYRVRATARNNRIELVKQYFASFGSQFEVVEVNDISYDDISSNFAGVNALIHAAAPAAFKTPDAEKLLRHAISAAMNVIRQAVKAGISKIVYTSSTVTSDNSDRTKPISNKEWNAMTPAEAIAAGPWAGYRVGKTISEKAVWAFAAEHPEIDITVLNPHLMLGPLAPGVFLKKGDFPSISTSIYLYGLIHGTDQFGSAPGAVDVRDVARMHVGALKSQPGPDKRVMISAPFPTNYAVAIETIAAKRPQLAGNLADLEAAKKITVDQVFVDQKKIVEVTGVKVDDYTPWVDTVLDGIDNLAAITADW